MGGKAVRAGDHALGICYLRGAAQWAARRRRVNLVSRGGVDLAPLSWGKAAALVGPPFQKFLIGNKRYQNGISYFRLHCTHTSTPSGEQHRPPRRGESNPPSDLLGEEAGSPLFPRARFLGTYGPGARVGSRRFSPEGGPPLSMGTILPLGALPSPHIRGGRPPRRVDRNSSPPGRRGRCGR